MELFPVFLDLAGRRCLLVGGGEAASRKAALLRRAGAQVLVVAPALGPELAEAVARGEATHLAGAFAPPQLDGAALAIVADAPPAVAEAVSRAARARGLPVNVVDVPRLCSFVMPAIVDRSPVVVAIATAGTAPALARWLRQLLDRRLPRRLGRLARWIALHRPLVRSRLPDLAARGRFWETALAGGIAEQVLAGDEAGATATLRSALDAAAPAGAEARPDAA